MYSGKEPLLVRQRFLSSEPDELWALASSQKPAENFSVRQPLNISTPQPITPSEEHFELEAPSWPQVLAPKRNAASQSFREHPTPTPAPVAQCCGSCLSKLISRPEKKTFRPFIKKTTPVEEDRRTKEKQAEESSRIELKRLLRESMPFSKKIIPRAYEIDRSEGEQDIDFNDIIKIPPPLKKEMNVSFPTQTSSLFGKKSDVIPSKITENPFSKKSEESLETNKIDLNKNTQKDLFSKNTDNLFGKKTETLFPRNTEDLSVSKIEGNPFDKKKDDLLAKRTDNPFANKTDNLFENKQDNPFAKKSENLFEKKTEDLLPKKTENLLEKKTGDLFPKNTENPFEKKTEDLFAKKPENPFEKKTEDLFAKKPENPFEKKTEDLFAKKPENPFEKKTEDLFAKKPENPFEKKTENLFEKKIENPFEKKTEDLFAKKPENPFEKKTENLFQKKSDNPFEKKQDDIFNKKEVDNVINKSEDLLDKKPDDKSKNSDLLISTKPNEIFVFKGESLFEKKSNDLFSKIPENPFSKPGSSVSQIKTTLFDQIPETTTKLAPFKLSGNTGESLFDPKDNNLFSKKQKSEEIEKPKEDKPNLGIFGLKVDTGSSLFESKDDDIFAKNAFSKTKSETSAPLSAAFFSQEKAPIESDKKDVNLAIFGIKDFKSLEKKQTLEVQHKYISNLCADPEDDNPTLPVKGILGPGGKLLTPNFADSNPSEEKKATTKLSISSSPFAVEKSSGIQPEEKEPINPSIPQPTNASAESSDDPLAAYRRKNLNGIETGDSGFFQHRNVSSGVDKENP